MYGRSTYRTGFLFYVQTNRVNPLAERMTHLSVSRLQTTNPVQHHSVDSLINESREDETPESFDCNV